MIMLTDIEVALEAFAEMEGEEYVITELIDFDEDTVSCYSLAGAVRWLANSPPEDGCSFEIYTQGGYRRYFVRPDGQVYYSEHHDGRNVDRARDAGFDIL